MIVRVPALGGPPAAVSDPGERGVRIGHLLWRPLLDRGRSIVQPLAAAVHPTKEGPGLDVHLDPDAQWSDGEPVLAHEVVATARSLASAGHVQIVASGDRLVQFRGAGSTSLAKQVIPVRAAGGPGPTPTSGPYDLDSIGTTRVVLRCRDASGGLPDTVELVAIPDLDEALAHVRSGRVHAVLEADEQTVAEVIASPGPAVLALPDTTRVVQVLGAGRRAAAPSGATVTSRVDQEALARDVYGGLAQPGRSRVDCTLSVERTVHLLVNSENRLRRAAAKQIVAAWAANGVDARVDVEPWPAFVARLADGAFDAFLVSVRDTDDTARVLRRVTNGHLVGPPAELTAHAPWAVLTPSALARVPVLVALCGGGDQC